MWEVTSACDTCCTQQIQLEVDTLYCVCGRENVQLVSQSTWSDQKMSPVSTWSKNERSVYKKKKNEEEMHF